MQNYPAYVKQKVDVFGIDCVSGQIKRNRRQFGPLGMEPMNRAQIHRRNHGGK